MIRVNSKIFAAVLAVAFSTAASASSVDISGPENANLNTYYAGNVYPSNGGPITIGGINFNLLSLNPGTGIVQAGGGSSFDIAVGQSGVTTVYSIINSAFGQFGSTIGSLIFNGSLGATYTYNLTEGDNVRDHATTVFNIIAPNVYATHDFGSGDRLDVQQIILPAAFASQTLTDIVFSSTVDGNGDPFLAGITTNVSAVPEPSTWAMMILGFASIGFVTYRRKAATFVA